MVGLGVGASRRSQESGCARVHELVSWPKRRPIPIGMYLTVFRPDVGGNDYGRLYERNDGVGVGGRARTRHGQIVHGALKLTGYDE